MQADNKGRALIANHVRCVKYVGPMFTVRCGVSRCCLQKKYLPRIQLIAYDTKHERTKYPLEEERTLRSILVRVII